MKILQQRFIRYDGSDFYVTHLYSEVGHFERNNLPSGIHIELGTNDIASNYTEIDDGIHREVPESLPDIILPEPEDEEATEEDYQDALEELGVTIDRENEQ